MKSKIKKKLMILLDFQLNSLGWFTARSYYLENTVGFILGVTIICIADTLII